jgi:hypothetical protein
MYRRDEVIQALFGRVGFRQPTQAEYAIVDADNLEAKSKRYFDGFHAEVTIQNLKDAANADVNITDADFNKGLKNLQEDCIASVLDGVFGEPEVIEQQTEFLTTDWKPILIPNSGRFVGRQIKVAADPRKSVRINAVTLFFNGVTTFPLYLFSSVKKLPIRILEVTTEADSQVVVVPEDWVLNYLDGNIKGGLFYLGYFQDDLGLVQAYDEQPSQWICGKIYGSNIIETIPVPGQTDFIRYNPYITSRTQGINIEFSSVVDFTEVIVKNPQAFDKAIGLQMAAMVIEKLIHSTRSNYLQRIGEAGAARLYNDLNLDMTTPELPYSSGLKNQLRRELTRLHNNFFPKQKAVSNSIQPSSCYIPKRHR